MLELLIVACLGAGQCRDFPQIYDPYSVSLTTCMVVGQAEVARWQGAHPGWTVARWRCGYVDERMTAT